MKTISIFIIAFFVQLNVAGQNQSFYTINMQYNSLTMIDISGNETDIGYIGRTVRSNVCGLTFYNGRLYFSMSDTLFSVNTNTGYCTPIVRTYSALTGQGVWGSIYFNSLGELYLFRELSSWPQGRLYKVDTITGLATPFSLASGDPSIPSIAFLNDSLFGVSELNDKLLLFNLSTGNTTSINSNMIGMGFTNAITNANGKLYGIDITNETGSDSTRLCFIDQSTGHSTWKHTFRNIYTGLANGCMYCNTSVPNVETKQHLEVFPNPSYGVFIIRNNGFIYGGRIELTDLIGRSIYSMDIPNEHWNEKQISLSDKLSDGIYIVTVRSQKNIFSGKIIINNK